MKESRESYIAGLEGGKRRDKLSNKSIISKTENQQDLIWKAILSILQKFSPHVLDARSVVEGYKEK